MNSLNPFLILIQLLFVILISRSEVGAADASPCAALLHPLESKVEEIKGQGGIWGMFDKNYKVRNHATVTLKLDSKITVLIVRLNHLCTTQNGVPLEEIAQILVPRLKAEGEKAVIEDLINLGHLEEEAEKLIAYARSSNPINTCPKPGGGDACTSKNASKLKHPQPMKIHPNSLSPRGVKKPAECSAQP